MYKKTVESVYLTNGGKTAKNNVNENHSQQHKKGNNMKTITVKDSFMNKDIEKTLEQYIEAWTSTIKQAAWLCDTLEEMQEQKKMLESMEKLATNEFNRIYDKQNPAEEVETVTAAEEVETMTTINDLKIDEFFKRKPTGKKIYKRGEYCRQTKSFMCYDVDNINKQINIKSNKQIYTNFEY